MIRAFLHDCGEAALNGDPAPTVTSVHADRIRDGATRFLRGIEAAHEREWVPSAAPVVSSLGPGTTPLGRRFRELAPGLPWSGARQDPDGISRGIVSLNDLFDLGPMTAGLLCARPDAGYPEHQHPPQELYVVLDGTAAWRFGGADHHVDTPPGATLYNPPSALHGIRNPDQAVVALYVLWEDGDALDTVPDRSEVDRPRSIVIAARP